MSDRYSRLFSLAPNQYGEGSPVLISAGALLKDNVTGQILAQLKFKSISLKRIKAIKVALSPLDAAGRPLEERVEHQFLDLSADRGAEFGQKKAIPMPNLSTRSFSVTVSEVVFSDNSIYAASGEIFAPLPNPRPLSDQLRTAELRKQFLLTCGNHSAYIPTSIKDLWYCTCGQLNHGEESTCWSCRSKRADLTAAMDIAALTTAMNQRLAEEAKIAEQRRQEQEAAAARKKQKTRRIALILTSCVAFAALTFVSLKFWLLPTIQYQNALTMMENAQYDSAKKQLLALNGFGKSEQQLDVLAGIRHIETFSSQGSLEKGIRTVLAADTPVTVNFETKGGTVPQNPITYQSEDEFSGLPDAEQEGFRFLCWTRQSVSYQKKHPLSITVSADWSDEFSIHYELDGGVAGNPTDYRNDGKEIKLRNATKKGYTFIGWTGTNLTTPTKNYVIPAGTYGNLSYTAHWKANTYTISFVLDGGVNAPDTLSATYDAVITLPEPTKTGFTFVGWFGNGKEFTSGPWAYADNIVLSAKWDPVKYTITYNLNGGKNASQNPATYHVESGTITLQAPTKTGYKFLGWYTDAAFQNKATTLSGSAMKNVTLYAKWELATYTITYNLNGGTLSSMVVKSFTINDLPVTLPSASKGSMAFAGWNYGSASGKTVEKLTACENVTLFASFMDPNLKLALSRDGKYYEVSGYSGSATHLEIPAYYKNIPVKVVDYLGYSDFVSVVLPSTLTEIGTGAFYACKNLTSINIPEGVTKIGNEAFYECNALRNVTIPDSVTSIGDDAFYWCTSLTTVKMPNKLTDLGEGTFTFCRSLKSIVIPEGVKKLEWGVFYDCSALESVTLPNTLTKIDGAFYYCTNLKKIIIPSSVTSISSSSFTGCNKVNFYCRVNMIPSGWDGGWNNSRPVTWGYTGN